MTLRERMAARQRRRRVHPAIRLKITSNRDGTLVDLDSDSLYLLALAAGGAEDLLQLPGGQLIVRIEAVELPNW